MKVKKLLAGVASTSALFIGGGIGLIAATAPAAHADTVLAGDSSLTGNADSNGYDPVAFGYFASSSGTATDMKIYIGDSPHGAIVGVYSSVLVGEADHPGTLLASGTVPYNVENSWVDIPLDQSVSITADTKYFLSVASTSSTNGVDIEDTPSGSTGYQDVGDGPAPSTFTSDESYSDGPASMYLVNTPNLVGNANQQGNSDSVTGTHDACFSFTANESGTANDISAYITSTSGVKLTLMSDSSGAPGSVLDAGMTSSDSNTAGWVTLPLSGDVSLTASDTYWLCIGESNNNPEESYTVDFQDVSGGSSSYSDEATGQFYSTPWTSADNAPAAIFINS